MSPLGIASAADIKTRSYQSSPKEVTRVRQFIEQCQVAWITRRSEPAAAALEGRLKAEWVPPLTKR